MFSAYITRVVSPVLSSGALARLHLFGRNTKVGLAAIVRYKETRWLGMHKQSGTRAGNHRRHTRIRNTIPQTQVNNAARAPKSKPPTRARYMHLTKTPHNHHHPAPRATKAPGTDKPARHPLRAQQEPAQRTHNCNRGAGATPRRPKSRPDTAAPTP